MTPVERVARAIFIGAFCTSESGEAFWGRPGYADAEQKKAWVVARSAIEALREPTVSMLAKAFPCEANEEFSHADKKLGAAVCMTLGRGKDIGLLEGEAVKQAAFLARDYRIMITAALSEGE